MAAISILGLGAGQLETIFLPHTLSSHTIKLDERIDGGGWASDIMADNILLTLDYLNSSSVDPEDINWDDVRRNREIDFKLMPNETFAFQEDVLPEYQGKIAKTTNAHFNYQEGFKSDGYLVGDGVCHLASLMYWVAKDASLDALAPTNHNFMTIPGISREYGVSIFYSPEAKASNSKQNLYIRNNKPNPILFKFVVNDKNLEASVEED
ncbi:VanW family protein [Candidatus Daviesbacteria bacterium]|nr:VanW family protein [Candidatus Daviesbacteria bacterium]